MNAKFITVIDVTDNTKFAYLSTLLGAFEMSKKELCFCSSSKKMKKCHGDIHEKSVIANLYRKMNIIDEAVKQCTDSICKKGCCDCCTADFPVSVSEFFLIVNALEIGGTKAQLLPYRKDAAELISNPPLNANRCLFVDEKDGSCKIYDVRPLVCREYGNIRLENAVCKKITENIKAQEGMLNSIDVDFNKDTNAFSENEQIVFSQLKPMVFFFSNLADDGDFKTEKMKNLYEAAFNCPASEFLRIIKL